MPHSEPERARAARWFRDTLAALLEGGTTEDAATEDGATPPPPPDLALEAADAELFAEARACLETLTEDYVRSALLAGDAAARCRRSHWNELASLLDLVRHVSVLPASERIGDLIDPANSPDPSGDRLQEMLSERPPQSASAMDLMLLELAVATRHDPLVLRSPGPLVSWQRLDEHLGHLGALAGLAADARLAGLAAYATELQLGILAQLAAAAGREAAWERAARYRARYRALWRPGAEGSGAEYPAPAPGRRRRLEQLFQNLARLHDLGMRHGALLLENVGPSGELGRFARTEFRDQNLQQAIDGAVEAAAEGDWDQLDLYRDLRPGSWEPQSAADLEWLADDLIPLRYQLDQEEWEHGRDSYLQAASSSKAAQVLGVVEALAPQEKVDQAQDQLPSRDPREPDIRIRVADLLLRHDPTASVNPPAEAADGPATIVDPPPGDAAADRVQSGSAADPAPGADLTAVTETSPAAQASPTPQSSPTWQASPEALAAIRDRDWIAAAARLRADLGDLERRAPEARACQNTAALLASILTNCLEFFPQQRERIRAEILGLAARYGPRLLADVRSAGSAGEPGDDRKAVESSLGAASNLGYAMTSALPAGTADIAAVELSFQLLREAAERTDPAAAPELYAIRANNLALGYRLLGGVTTGDQRLENLTRAEALLVEVARIDEAAALSGSGPDTRYIDYANLGDVRAELADHTYDAEWVSQKPTESARWYRAALDAYHRSADLADQLDKPENVAHADVRAGVVYLELCNHYALERYFAGGDLHPAFYDWLRAFAGGHVRTDRLVASWAASALACVSRAARISLPRNPSLVIECIEAAIRLWSLSQWRSAVPRELGRPALAMIVEVTDELDDSGMLRTLPDELGSLTELRPYWAAMLSFEAYRIGVGGEAQVRSAWQRLEHLSRTGSSVARALAWPQRLALEFDRGDHGLLVNGLLIETDNDRIALGIPSLRRTVRLEGVTLEGVAGQVRDQHYLRAASQTALSHLTPLLAWDDLPPEVLVGFGRGFAGRSRVAVETFRIPTSGWDSWLVRLDSDGGDALEIGISLPYLGRYDQLTGVLDTESAAVLRRETEVLVFGEQGITLEVTAPLLGEDPEPDGEPRVELASDDRATPTVRSHVRALHLLLKASPRIAFSDVVFLVRDDGGPGAAVCAASFAHAAPSVAFPAAAMHGFAPLLFFGDRLDATAFGWLNEIRPRAVVIVGAPEDADDAVRLLLDLFDPRRDLLWLVEEQEAGIAWQALAEAKARILATPGARYLLRAASSATAPYDISVNFQLAVVPRDLAPAAAQMLLDLAAIRYRDAENILVVIEDKPTYLNIAGNALYALRRSTLFDGPATWDALADRYHRLIGRAAAGEVVLDSGAISAGIYEGLMPKVPRRPVVFFDPASTAAIAAIPHARLLGALYLPLGETSFDLLRRLEPAEVHAPRHAVAAVPPGSWTTIPMPGDPRDIATAFQARVRAEHATQLGELAQTHPHLVASKALLEEMQPAKYVVLSPADPAERSFGFLAANYAASLQAPLYLMTEAAEALRQGQFHEVRAQAESFMTGRGLAAGSMSRGTRDIITREAAAMPGQLGELFATTCADLDALAPDYVSLVSSFAAFPIELIGTPPLATRFAVGRLMGPDLPATALLVARAALSEDVTRPADIHAVLADCADALPDKVVPEARAEVRAVSAHLARQPHVRTTLIDGPGDLSRFLREAGEANIVHFAGHCWFDPHRPDECGLIFRDGVLTSASFSAVLDDLPVVFSNACETGLLSPAHGAEGVLWTGVAASFLAAGAVNYLGSMWPVFDESSRRVAQFFYERLCAGEPIGEALRRARLDAYERNDPTWAAYVLFGCPRNRLRPRPT